MRAVFRPCHALLNLPGVARWHTNTPLPGSLKEGGFSTHTVPLDWKRNSLSGHKSDLLHHVRLLDRILQGSDPFVVKRRRVGGLLRKFETSHVDWFAAEVKHEKELPLVCRYTIGCFSTLAGVLRTADFNPEHDISRASIVSEELFDMLSICFHTAAEGPLDLKEKRSLLHEAVDLGIEGGDTFLYLITELTSREACEALSPLELSTLLRDISLLVKRGKVALMPLDNVLCRLPSTPFNPRETLVVLSSLLRLSGVNAVEAVSILSRNATKDVFSVYTAKDIVFALEVIAFLDGCHHEYASAVLLKCAKEMKHMNARQVGTACKYIALLNDKRATNKVGVYCGREVRRVLPSIVERADQLTGEFSFKEARYVIRCLSQHKQKHSIVLSKLSPVTSSQL